MPRLSNEQINDRVRAAMTPVQPTQRGASQQTMETLLQKARERRVPEQKARGM